MLKDEQGGRVRGGYLSDTFGETSNLLLNALVTQLFRRMMNLTAAQNSKAKSQIIWTTFFQFHGTISLEFSAGHSKKCTNTVSIQIAAKNLLVCPGPPVESEEICDCVWQLNVDGCIWIGRGGREGGGGRA